MHKFDSIQWFVVTTCCCLLICTGCNRNRTALTPFNSTYAPLAGSTAVNAPPTYSLNIPGAQNYYNGGVNQLPQRQAQNTLPANNINLQSGWRASGATNNNAETNSTIGGNTTTNNTGGNSVIENGQNRNTNRTQVVSVTQPNRDQFVQNAAVRVAQNQNANGLSFTDRTNFRTTAVDERLDRTRLPVTDASQVRAPTNFTPATTVGQFNVPYYVPGQQQLAQNPQARLANNQLNNQGYIPAARVAQGNFVGPNTVVGSFGQPTFAQPTGQPYSGASTQNRVLAQSTVYADPQNDPNFQSGWRDRELTASRDSLNR